MIDLIAYLRPTSLAELWETIDDATVPITLSAGCTDLIPKARAGLLPEGTWIDLRRIPELSSMEVEADHIRLGACLTHHRVASSAPIREELPALAAACAAVGSRQIRSLGTLGGNAANCSPCADSFLALTALDAEVVLRSPGGRRQIAATDFPRGPGETVLAEDEMIEAFVVPRRPERRSSFVKLGPRRAVAVAKVSVSASAVMDDGTLSDVRLALGSVAPTIIRVSEAEAALEGNKLDTGLLREVSRLVENAVRPIDDVRSSAAYRKVTSGVLARRALLALDA